jgi:hypothetical protein
LSPPPDLVTSVVVAGRRMEGASTDPGPLLPESAMMVACPERDAIRRPSLRLHLFNINKGPSPLWALASGGVRSSRSSASEEDAQICTTMECWWTRPYCSITIRSGRVADDHSPFQGSRWPRSASVFGAYCPKLGSPWHPMDTEPQPSYTWETLSDVQWGTSTTVPWQKGGCLIGRVNHCLPSWASHACLSNFRPQTIHSHSASPQPNSWEISDNFSLGRTLV